ncbi:hypothetical protein D3C86_2263750 [compost metagenome]
MLQAYYDTLVKRICLQQRRFLKKEGGAHNVQANGDGFCFIFRPAHDSDRGFH